MHPDTDNRKSSSGPAGAISKRPEDGIVVVDRNECVGSGNCGKACPYGAPQYGKDGKMQKCILCIDRLSLGQQPACVATCPGGALAYGTLEELAKLAASKGGERLKGDTGPALYLAVAKVDHPGKRHSSDSNRTRAMLQNIKATSHKAL